MPPTFLRTSLWTLVLILGGALALYATFATVHYEWNWKDTWVYREQLAWGWVTTMAISLGAMALSIFVGFSLMIGRRAPILPLRLLCTGIVELLRGSPLLVQLLIGYYIVASALHINDPLIVGMILLGCFEGAYLAEIFRGAVESIGASQREAARAVGFNRVQTYRYVIIPQAVRRALPGTTGQLVSLIKDSSLLSVIGIEELVQKVKILNSSSYTALEGYLPLAAAYLIVTLPLSWFAGRLERRFAYET
ncbi:amino acid ABC transporter membrane protein (PAAT family) [Prosthecobacter fusiformis]|uniref:Amino acid ABC transporter membrane protein (PAAT family) n=1 Tax=Prosthecobacter fusiformis TaxID=48464 RepID=A0A4R7RJG0_9BACT|nr:amino acid ABC transporter permease [Prosthecobacter fusiformis]TDU62519.1 amino acid ABC transporter membrane protein (PAAT family) [Prosthecobacter fusiformis]